MSGVQKSKFRASTARVEAEQARRWFNTTPPAVRPEDTELTTNRAARRRAKRKGTKT